MLSGNWRDASAAWERIGMPFEQALALAEGPEQALRDSLTILERLGAAPMASIVPQTPARDRGAEYTARPPRDHPDESGRADSSGNTGAAAAHAGYTNAQLARRLHRSKKTVDKHVAASARQTRSSVATQAIAVAFSLGIVQAKILEER